MERMRSRVRKTLLIGEIVRIRFSIFKFHVLFLMQTRVSDSFDQIKKQQNNKNSLNGVEKK